MSDNITYLSDEFMYRLGFASGRRTRPIQIFDASVLDVDHSAVNPAEQSSVPAFTEEAYIIHNRAIHDSDLQSSIPQTNYADRGFSPSDRTSK